MATSPEAAQKIRDSNFSPAGKERLKQIIAKARIADCEYDCGDLGAKYAHKIEGKLHWPVPQRPLDHHKAVEMDLMIDKLLVSGIIRAENYPRTNSPFMVLEKAESDEEGWMPVMDFRALNSQTKAVNASLIDRNSTIKTLQVKKFKSVLNLENAFFSIRLDKSSQMKTAFRHRREAYVWQRLPIGYKNSSKVLQMVVMDILKGTEATIYMGSVFISDNTEKDHLEKLQKITERLKTAGFKLSLKKCQFGQFQVKYVGIEVSAELRLSDVYLKKLDQICPPASEKDLQRILGICNTMRDHVPNYQKFAKPLYDILKKKKGTANNHRKTWTWTASDQKNLDRLKEAVRVAENLEPRLHTSRLVAEISCEDETAGVRVSNEGAGTVAWWSCTLSLVEQEYPPEEKELAVLAKYWDRLKELAQNMGIKVITQSKVHHSLRKEDVKNSQARKVRWEVWEKILLDPDLELSQAQASSENTEPWGSLCLGVVGPLVLTGKMGEKYMLVLVDCATEYVVVSPVTKCDGSTVVQMLDQACVCQGVPKELWTDNGTGNAQVSQWCQQHGVMRMDLPEYSTPGEQVLKQTIVRVENWIAKNATSEEWSTKVLEIGKALNDRQRGDRPPPPSS